MGCEITLEERSMYRGNTYKFTMTVKADGVVLNITDYIARMTVRQNFPTPSTVDDSDAAISIIGLIAVGTDGKVQYEIIPSETQDLNVGDYYYDLEIESPAGETYTFGVGIFNILSEITRD